MADLERRMYLPESPESAPEIHLSLVSPGQDPEDFNPHNDLYRAYSLFEILSLGKGKLQAGLDAAFGALESEREIEEESEETPRVQKKQVEKNISLSEDGDFVVAIAEMSTDPKGNLMASSTGDIYSQYELIVLGRGSMVEGMNRVHEALEVSMSQGEEIVFDMNHAMGDWIDPDERPLQGELNLMLMPTKGNPTH